ncbi:MAG TPA: hypothetical protein VF193_08860 [Steroidobacter sp.]|jgi:hypothetical protein
MQEDTERTAAQAEHEHWVEDDQWLDEVLSQTFPASDPIPWCREETTAPARRRRGQENRQST